jgi:hypothetical protein
MKTPFKHLPIQMPPINTQKLPPTTALAASIESSPFARVTGMAN